MLQGAPVDSRLTGAILAGGAARRLQCRDKGLLHWRGAPLIQTCISQLCPQVNDLLIVANRHLDEYARYARVVPDRVAGFGGPLQGIASALHAATSRWVLIVPVDCPNLPADLALRLRAALHGQQRATVAHDGQRRQPLFALYDTAVASSAAVAADLGLPVWNWQDQIAAQEVDFSDRRSQFMNLNLPADFEPDAGPRHD